MPGGGGDEKIRFITNILFCEAIKDGKLNYSFNRRFDQGLSEGSCSKKKWIMILQGIVVGV